MATAACAGHRVVIASQIGARAIGSQLASGDRPGYVRRMANLIGVGRDWVTCASLLRAGLGVLFGLLSACASGPEACRHDVITGADQCEPASGSYAEAAGTAAVAAGAWAIAGCTVNGCEAPFVCNTKTKLCERTSCGEGKGSCPPGYACDPKDSLCR